MIPQLLEGLRALIAQGWHDPSTSDLAARARLPRDAAAAALAKAEHAGLVLRQRHPRSRQWGPRCSSWRLP